MFPEGTPLSEALAAEGAAERFLSGVCSHVQSEMTPLWKTFATQQTPEGFVPVWTLVCWTSRHLAVKLSS